MRRVPLLLGWLCACAPATISEPADVPEPLGAPDVPRPAAAATTAPADARLERAKIERLLAAIRGSTIVFVRNGTDHQAAAAAEHLSSKLENAGDEVKSARDFIDKLASRSSMSGEPYEVRLADGKKMPARDWLLERLREIEAAPR